MVDLIAGLVGNVLIGASLFVYTDVLSRRHKALRQHREILIVIVLGWMAMTPVKLFYVDVIHPPVDAALHEEVARDVAFLLRDQEFNSAADYFGPGNKGFRFALGAFYALTGAPKSVTYGLFAGVTLWGLLSLLDLSCTLVRPDRAPLWLVGVICAAPSALFWTTGVLKEGPVLWGIAMMLRYTLHAQPGAAVSGKGLILPTLGLAVVGFLRPHIAAAWLAGIWTGSAVIRGRIGLGVFGILAFSGLVISLEQIRPDTITKLMEDGMVETLNSGFESREGIGGSAIVYTNGAPIPVLDGLLLLLFRPFPTEVSDWESVLAGLEIWFLSFMAALSWLKLPGKKAVLMNPFIVTVITALLCLAFFFTYSYNMGLMVRQRLQAFPAILSLIAIPTLYACRARSALRRPGIRAFRDGPTPPRAPSTRQGTATTG